MRNWQHQMAAVLAPDAELLWPVAGSIVQLQRLRIVPRKSGFTFAVCGPERLSRRCLQTPLLKVGEKAHAPKPSILFSSNVSAHQSGWYGCSCVQTCLFASEFHISARVRRRHLGLDTVAWGVQQLQFVSLEACSLDHGAVVRPV